MDLSKLDLIHYILFAIVVILLFRRRPSADKTQSIRPAVWAGIKDGFRSITLFTEIGTVLLLMVAVAIAPTLIGVFIMELPMQARPGYSLGIIVLMYIPVLVALVFYKAVRERVRKFRQEQKPVVVDETAELVVNRMAKQVQAAKEQMRMQPAGGEFVEA